MGNGRVGKKIKLVAILYKVAKTFLLLGWRHLES